MKYRLIDLFCGAGGMTLGFVDSRFGGGFEPVLCVDNDKAAIRTHGERFGRETSVEDDLERLIKQRRGIPQADVVIGGPPCQGFSLLNKKRAKKDARRALWEPYLDVVRLSKAQVFVMENVPELIASREFLEIKARAEAMGFRVLPPEVLNAADYGTAQVRKRAIIIGIRGRGSQSIVFPPPSTHRDPRRGSAVSLFSSGDKKRELDNWKTVREAFKGLKKPVGTEIREKKNRIDPNDLHFGRNPTELSLRRYAAVPEGGNRFDLQRNARKLTPACWIRKTSGGTDLFGRLWWDRPSVTIRTEFFKPEKGRYLHPIENRPITHREAARIMGFPDDFVFLGSKTEIARQIGNAVPPDLAGAIAKVVKQYLDIKLAPRKRNRGSSVAARRRAA